MYGMALLKYYDKWDNNNFREEDRTTDTEGKSSVSQSLR